MKKILQKFGYLLISRNREICSPNVLIRQIYSQYGTYLSLAIKFNILKISIFAINNCVGILYANKLLPNIKRKIEMENFEGNENYSLLHTYLYVSYLDTLNKLNNIKLTNQKDSYLRQLSSNSNYTNNLCLNLIMNYEDLINS
jgi:hypothetical protein